MPSLHERFVAWSESRKELTEEITIELSETRWRLLRILAVALETSPERVASFFVSEGVERALDEICTIDWKHWGRVDAATLAEFAALEAGVNPNAAKLYWRSEREAAASAFAVGFFNSLQLQRSDDASLRLHSVFAEQDRRRRFYDALRLGLAALKGGVLRSCNDRRDDEAIIRASDYLEWARTKQLGLWDTARDQPAHEDVLEGWKEIIAASGLVIAEKQLRARLAHARFEKRRRGRIVRIRRVELERALSETKPVV